MICVLYNALCLVYCVSYTVKRTALKDREDSLLLYNSPKHQETRTYNKKHTKPLKKW
jgi:hypothetical protein